MKKRVTCFKYLGMSGYCWTIGDFLRFYFTRISECFTAHTIYSVHQGTKARKIYWKILSSNIQHL